MPAIPTFSEAIPGLSHLPRHFCNSPGIEGEISTKFVNGIHRVLTVWIIGFSIIFNFVLFFLPGGESILNSNRLLTTIRTIKRRKHAYLCLLSCKTWCYKLSRSKFFHLKKREPIKRSWSLNYGFKSFC